MPVYRLASRAVLRLAPETEDEDVRSFLQRLITNDVTGDLPQWAGLLNPQGKTLFDFLVWPDVRDSRSLLLDCEAAHADALLRRLTLYRLRSKIRIERVESLSVYWTPDSPPPEASADPRLSALGFRWLAPAGSDIAEGDSAWLAHRLSLGVAEGEDELNGVLWLETNAAELNGVSFTKGCYIGQENTARMNWRQKVNRRLTVVSLDHSDEKRRKQEWPELGLALDLVRVADISNPPDWLTQSLEITSGD